MSVVDIQLGSDEQLIKVNGDRVVNWLTAVRAQELQLLLGESAMLEAIRAMNPEQSSSVLVAVQGALNALRAIQRVSTMQGDVDSEHADGLTAEVVESVLDVPQRGIVDEMVVPGLTEPIAVNEPDATTEQRMWREDVTKEALDLIADTDVTFDMVQEGLAELLANAGVDGTIDQSRSRATLLRLAERLTDVPADMSEEYLLSLVKTYLTSSKFTSMSARVVNSICFAAYAKGCSLQSIVPYREITKPQAKNQDVHNARLAVEAGIIRAEELRHQQETKPTIAFEAGDDTEKVPVVITAVKRAALPVADAQPVVPHERSMNEEPTHIQEAAHFLEILQLDSSYRAAMEALLNPDSRGEVSLHMQEIIDVINNVISTLSVKSDVLNSMEVTNTKGKIAFRRLIGRFNTVDGRPVKQPAIRLSAQFVKDSPAARRANTAAFFEFLPHVRALLASRRPLVVSQPVTPKPVYRIEDDGNVGVA